MGQPDASPRLIGSLRALADDVGRAFLVDEVCLDHGAVSRTLRADRDDPTSIRPTLGLAEVIVQRARRGDGRRARVEEFLSALAGEPVRLGLPETAPVPSAPASPAEVVSRVCALSEEAGGLAAQLARDAADGRLDAGEVERAMHRAAAVHDRLAETLRALRGEG